MSGRPADSRPPSSGWTCFNQWNAAILRHLYRSEAAVNQPIYLDVDGDWFARAARDVATSCPSVAGSKSRQLASALVGTLGEPGVGVFRPHWVRTLAWDVNSADRDPPFVTLLAFCAAIAEEMTADRQFAAHNYYGRMHATLEEIGGRRLAKAAVERSYRRDVHPMWDFLNEWIEEGAGERGIPTAYGTSTLPYVSVPIGQALLRVNDRIWLHKLFDQYFPGERDLEPEEVAEALAGVVKSPPFSGSIARVWANKDRRPLLASVFARELSQWDGSVVDERGRTTARALVTATVSTFPARAISLQVEIHNSQTARGDFTPRSTSDSAVLREGLERLQFAPTGPGARLAQPVQSDAFVLEEVLQRSFVLLGEHLDVARRLRNCVPLSLDPGEQRWVESDSIPLAAPALVLLRESYQVEFETLLREVARPGWTNYSSEQMRGLRAGWLAFLNVELLSAGSSAPMPPDIAAVLPAPRLVISLGNGIRLPAAGGQREWLSGHPPEIVVAEPRGRDVSVTLAAEADETAEQVGVVLGAGAFTLGGELADGQYTVRAAVEEGGATSTRFRVRSPDSARNMREGSEIVARLDDSAMICALAERSKVGELPWISTLVPPARATENPTDVEFAHRAEWPAASDERDDLQVGLSEPHPRPNAEPLPRCAIRPGAHGWDIPATQAKVVQGVCRFCGARRYFVNSWYGRQAALREVLARNAPKEFIQAIASVRPIGGSNTDEWDGLLGALSAIRSGSWQTFETLARSTVPSLRPVEVSWNLFALGHADFAFGNLGSVPGVWSVVDSAAMHLESAPFVLCGSRSRSLLDSLARDGGAHSGSVRVDAIPGQPRLVTTVTSPDGSLSVGSPLQLLSRLPRLQEVERNLEVATPSGRIETFDLRTLNWAEGIPLAGAAVRFGTMPRTYGVAIEQHGTIRVLRGDYRLAKHLAARRTGVPLIAYDPAAQELSTPLGARLPSLYERVAVLCSGRLSEVRGGRHVYSSVPPLVAGGLWHRFGGRAA